jgi:hypothetical protein
MTHVHAGSREGGEDGGKGCDHDFLQVGRLCHVAAVRRSGSPVNDEKRLFFSTHSFSHPSDFRPHGGVDLRFDLPCGSFHGKPERFGYLLPQNLAGLVEIELHGPAEEVCGVQDPKDEICVGYRRIDSPQVETDRAGQGAGRLGAYLERSVYHRGDRSAAGSDGADLHHRHVYNEPFDVRPQGIARLSVSYVSEVKRGPSHVRRNQAPFPVELPRRSCSKKTGGRARVVGVNRPGLGHPGHGGVVVNDEEALSVELLTKVLARLVQQSGKFAVDVGVEYGCVNSLGPPGASRDV